jgi:hypothetical protein
MSTPGTAVAPYQGSAPPDKGVSASAVSSAKSSAVFSLGQVLKTVIMKAQVFAHENDLDNAIRTVDDFVRAFVPGGEMPALLTGAEYAAKEDVTQRIPPGGAPVNVSTAPQMDYAKLAQAILAEQRKMQIESPTDK